MRGKLAAAVSVLGTLSVLAPGGCSSGSFVPPEDAAPDVVVVVRDVVFSVPDAARDEVDGAPAAEVSGDAGGYEDAPIPSDLPFDSHGTADTGEMVDTGAREFSDSEADAGEPADLASLLGYDGTTLRTNSCPSGLSWFRGNWRYFEDDPDYPDPALFAEVLSIEGRCWYDEMRGSDEGHQTDAVVEGWYLCAEPPEVRESLAVFVTTSATPEGAFGYETGLVWSARLERSVAQPDDNVLLVTFEGIGGPLFRRYAYCRIGAVVQGSVCGDPFATEAGGGE